MAVVWGYYRDEIAILECVENYHRDIFYFPFRSNKLPVQINSVLKTTELTKEKVIIIMKNVGQRLL